MRWKATVDALPLPIGPVSAGSFAGCHPDVSSSQEALTSLGAAGGVRPSRCAGNRSAREFQRTTDTVLLG